MSRTALSTVAVGVWDAGVLLADVNVGAVATTLTAIGGVAIWFMTNWTKTRAESLANAYTKRAEAKAAAHKIWLDSHSGELEQEQARLRRDLQQATAERETLARQVADLTHRLDERDRTILEVRGNSDMLQLENQEYVRQLLTQDGIVMQTTTKIMAPAPSDAIPAADPPQPKAGP